MRAAAAMAATATRGQKLVLALLILIGACCQPRLQGDDVTNDEHEHEHERYENGESGEDALRLLVDLFNIAVLFLEHCGGLSGSDAAGLKACHDWMAAMGLLFLGVAAGCFVVDRLGVELNEDRKYRKRRRRALDALRVACLGANLQKLQGGGTE